MRLLEVLVVLSIAGAAYFAVATDAHSAKAKDQTCLPIDRIVIDGEPFQGVWSITRDEGSQVAVVRISMNRNRR